MQEKIDDVLLTTKFQLKKVLCLNIAVGNVSQEKKEITINTQLAANFHASLLKKQWQKIQMVDMKRRLDEGEVKYKKVLEGIAQYKRF
jgi:large subunit ribosomal protein L10Ae